MEEDMIKCTNCHREVPAANFTIHSVHCQNHLTTCPKCKESVPRTELQNHVATYHKVVACKNCAEKMDQSLLDEHNKQICPKRLVDCKYCNIEAPASAVAEHEAYCGSRTELCKECGQYVMFKDQEEHERAGHPVTRKSKSQEDSARMSERLLGDIDFGGIRFNKISNMEQDSVVRHSPIKRTNDMPQVNTDANGIKNKEPVKPNLLAEDQGLSASELEMLLAYQLAENETLNTESLDFPFDMRNPREREPPAPDFVSTNSWIFDDAANPWQMFQDDVPFARPTETFADDTGSADFELPCEFCGLLYPPDLLIQHQSGCRPDIAHGISEYLDTGPEPKRTETSDNNSFKMDLNNGTNNETVFLPCEFCGIEYPSIFLVEHQNVCEENVDSRESSPAKETDVHSKPTIGPANVAKFEDVADEKSPPKDMLKHHVPKTVSHYSTRRNGTVLPSFERGRNVRSFPIDSESSVPKRTPNANWSVPASDSLLSRSMKREAAGKSIDRPMPRVRDVPIRLTAERKNLATRNMPVKLNGPSPFVNVNSDNLFGYSAGDSDICSDKESMNEKLFARQARKEMNVARELRNMTGARPKFQDDNKPNPSTNSRTRHSDIPEYLASANPNVQEAYRNFVTKQNQTRARLNSQLPARQSHDSNSHENGLSSPDHAGAVPKNKISKLPSSD